jgi:hypothetical protein
LEKEERWKLKLKILIPLFLISLVFFVPNSKAAISYETIVTPSGYLIQTNISYNNVGYWFARGNLTTFCKTSSNTVSTFNCINEGINHDSDNTYIVFNQTSPSGTNSVFTFHSVYEYINSEDITIDLISWSVVSKLENQNNNASWTFAPYMYRTDNQNYILCDEIASYDIFNLYETDLTTNYTTISTSFHSDCNSSLFNQTNSKNIIGFLGGGCPNQPSGPCNNNVDITSIYMKVIWHENNVVISSTLTNSQIALAIILLVVWIAFFILGCYLPSGIFCMISGFCAIVLSIIYILPFNDISFVVVLGLAICCFLIGIMLVVKGDC